MVRPLYYSPPPHQQLISSITRSGGVRTRGGRAHTRGTRHTSVLRDAPSIDISLPPVEETPITPMKVPSTPPVIPLVASSPQSIKATLVDEELVHIANDDQ
ncbi:hypothetical protein AAG906_035809 [Vitis piasezkii]